MPPTPDGQCAPSAADHHTPTKQKKKRAPTPDRRQRDVAARRAAKDEARRRRCPEMVYASFADLRAWGIAGNYTQLNNLVDDHGFPPGIMISKNTRVYPLDGPDGVRAWLRSRPSARRSSPHRTPVAKAEPEET
jgi:hypothetical protein